MDYSCQRRSADGQWSGGGRLSYADFVACGPTSKGFNQLPVTPRNADGQQHPPWLQVLPNFKNVPYYVDSDDDSGIGHSNGGQGERVSSTSSTEADATPDSSYPPSLINNFRIRRNQTSLTISAHSTRQQRYNHHPLRGVPPPPPGHPWSAPSRLAALHGEFRPPAVSTPDGKRVAPDGGDVFNPSAFFAARPLPPYEVAAAASRQLQRRASSGRDSHRLHPAWRDQNRTAPHVEPLRDPRSATSSADSSPIATNRKSVNRTIITSPIGYSKQSNSIVATPTITAATSGIARKHHRYHCFNQSNDGQQSQPEGIARRVRSYCGDNSYYANVYENAGDRDRTEVAVDPAWSSSSEQPTGRDLNRDVSPGEFGSCPQHYDLLPPTRPYHPPTLAALGGAGQLQRAKSASLASLITVDSSMVQVRACPASVIPASEMGDGNSTMSGSVGDLLVLSLRQSRPLPPPPAQVLARRSLPPPPLPLRPPAGRYRSPTHRPQQQQQQPAVVQHYDTPPRRPIAVVAVQGPSPGQSPVRQVPVPTPTPPVETINSPVSKEQVNAPDVAYAKVNKPRSRVSDAAANESTRLNTVENYSGDEVEPPLPPRNYKRNLVKSKKLSGSRGSLAEKMQGFTRSAKQVLRKAFSLEALNCKTDSLNESLDWDNEDDWSRVVGSPANSGAAQPRTPPRTVAAVKARDAAKRDRQQQLQLQGLRHSASPASPFFSSANSSMRSSPVSQQTLC